MLVFCVQMQIGRYATINMLDLNLLEVDFDMSNFRFSSGVKTQTVPYCYKSK